MARGLAVLGMLVAHLGTGHHYGVQGWGHEWMWIADGRSAALFATLAGVSLALMSRRADAEAPGPERAAQLRALRVKVLVRAGIVLVIGVALQALDTPIAVILPTYAVLFLMAVPLLHAPDRALLAVASVAVVLGPVVVLGVREATTGGVRPTRIDFGYGVGELIWGYYPALVWIAYLVVGLVMGRYLTRAGHAPGGAGLARPALVLLAVGVPVAVVGYGAGLLVGRGTDTDAWPGALASVSDHADTTFEVVGNLGVALAVVGLCLLATAWRPLAAVLSPLGACGAMALSVYTVQLVVIAFLGPASVWYPASNVPLLALGLGSMAGAWVWRMLLGRGPLERGLAWASDAAARATLGRTEARGA